MVGQEREVFPILVDFLIALIAGLWQTFMA
jgi:hypothetical protein